jgi:hypothetical protein
MVTGPDPPILDQQIERRGGKGSLYTKHIFPASPGMKFSFPPRAAGGSTSSWSLRVKEGDQTQAPFYDISVTPRDDEFRPAHGERLSRRDKAQRGPSTQQKLHYLHSATKTRIRQDQFFVTAPLPRANLV